MRVILPDGPCKGRTIEVSDINIEMGYVIVAEMPKIELEDYTRLDKIATTSEAKRHIYHLDMLGNVLLVRFEA